MSESTTDLLRFATIGSVDDGKSTLIGRLLVDTRQLFDDQLEAVAHASAKRGVGDLDLSFVTDGLRAEREQGITIDVAYRYAATPTRKFVIADCPGHVQYTRNMATGASTADVALVVLDATTGLKEQTRRHLCIAALLGVRYVIVAANKMDLAQWSQSTYNAVVSQMNDVGTRLGFSDTVVIPVSALRGDNVVERGFEASWYSGPTVLQALEEAPAGLWANSEAGARLPIQWVLRQHGGGRTYAGMVTGSHFSVGDAVTLLPSGVTATITGINGPRGSMTSAVPGLSVDLDIDQDTDAGRGDLLATAPLPTVTDEFEATLCWFSDRPLTPNSRLRLKHTTRSTPVRVNTISGTLDVETLTVTPTDQLVTNDIGLVSLLTADPIVVDDYRANRVTGSFILIDEVTNATVAAGMIGHASFI
ncbi:MAG: 50S ribosome-binding GTPase [Acidobacteria bacterium]|nr:50S ribosome-binding GTPase [Acidobacteriota bacterium]